LRMERTPVASRGSSHGCISDTGEYGTCCPPLRRDLPLGAKLGLPGGVTPLPENKGGSSLESETSYTCQSHTHTR
jgi:hypothetical protein